MEDVIKRIQEGDKNLLEIFINENKEYIYSYTSIYYDKLNDYEDLVQTAVYAFIKSIYNYKFTNDFYTRYSKMWISSYVNRFVLNNLRNVKDKEDAICIATKIYEKCRKHIKHDPSIDELVKFLNVSHFVAQDIIDIINYNNNLDIDVYSSIDNYSLEDEVIKKVDTEIFRKRFIDNMLTKKQREVVLLKYGFSGECMRTVDIAKTLGGGRTAKDDLNKKAIKRLERKCISELEKYI